MVCGAIWYGGKSTLVLSEDTINVDKHIEIIKKGFLPIFEGSSLNRQDDVFMEDGTTYHTAQKTTVLQWRVNQFGKYSLQRPTESVSGP